MRKSIKTTAAVLTATSMLAAMSMAAFADPLGPYTPVNGGNDIKMEKYLVLDQNANVPARTINFTISGDTTPVRSDGSTQDIYAGNDANKVTGTPTIGTAVFAPGQTTYTTAQAAPTTDGIQVATGTNDAVTLDAGEKYARSAVTMDFSGVTFNEPGVYRYVITEDTTTPVKGVEVPADHDRLLDVYVTTEGGNDLAVTGYVLHNGENGSSLANAASDNAATKAAGIQNEYTTYDLVIEHEIEGNQGSKDEYFPYTVTLTDLTPGETFTVDLSDAEATTSITGYNYDASTGGGVSNPTEITCPAGSTTATATFWLKDDQSVTIYGLSAGQAYDVVVEDDELIAQKYSSTQAIAGDDEVVSGKAPYEVQDTSISDDTTLTFTHTKNGVIPTGVILSVLPAIGLAAIGGAGVTVYALKKSKKEDEE